MKNVEYQEIIIHWKEKRPVSDLKMPSAGTKGVLYQIYGDHPVYGRDTLLYIGTTIRADRRIRAHLRGVFGYVNNLSISIGEIEDEAVSLKIPESILIACHKPSFNKEFIRDLPPEAKRQKIIVINNGCNGMLKTCCTNFWWVDHR